MAYEIPNFYVGVLPANVDFSVEANSQFIGVTAIAATATVGTGVGGAALGLPTLGGPIIGVLQNNPVIGEAGQVLQSGVSKVLCGGTFAVGALLAVNAAGKFIAAISGYYIVGVALETGANGAIASVLLQNNGIHA
jgi:hypothetical protein